MVMVSVYGRTASGRSVASVPDGWSIASQSAGNGVDIAIRPAMTDRHKIQNICIRKVFCQSLFSRGGNCGHQSKTLQNFNKSPESLHCFYFTFSPCRRDEGFKSSFQYCFPQIPCLLKMAYLNCLPVARL